MSGNLHKQKCPGLIKQEPVKYHREDESGNRMLTVGNGKGARQAPLASINMASTGQVNTGPTIV
jgi:hypothetical protein